MRHLQVAELSRRDGFISATAASRDANSPSHTAASTTHQDDSSDDDTLANEDDLFVQRRVGRGGRVLLERFQPAAPNYRPLKFLDDDQEYELLSDDDVMAAAPTVYDLALGEGAMDVDVQSRPHFGSSMPLDASAVNRKTLAWNLPNGGLLRGAAQLPPPSLDWRSRRTPLLTPKAEGSLQQS